VRAEPHSSRVAARHVHVLLISRERQLEGAPLPKAEGPRGDALRRESQHEGRPGLAAVSARLWRCVAAHIDGSGVTACCVHVATHRHLDAPERDVPRFRPFLRAVGSCELAHTSGAACAHVAELADGHDVARAVGGHAVDRGGQFRCEVVRPHRVPAAGVHDADEPVEVHAVRV